MVIQIPEKRMVQMEEMSKIWENSDSYEKGYLDGTIHAIVTMAHRDIKSKAHPKGN